MGQWNRDGGSTAYSLTWRRAAMHWSTASRSSLGSPWAVRLLIGWSVRGDGYGKLYRHCSSLRGRSEDARHSQGVVESVSSAGGVRCDDHLFEERVVVARVVGVFPRVVAIVEGGILDVSPPNDERMGKRVDDVEVHGFVETESCCCDL